MSLLQTIRNRRGSIFGAITGYVIIKILGWLTRRLVAGSVRQENPNDPSQPPTTTPVPRFSQEEVVDGEYEDIK